MKLVLAAVVATCLLGICRSGPIPVPGYGSCSSSCSRCNEEYDDYDTDSSCSPSCSCNDGCGGYNKDRSGSPSCSCNDGCGDSNADCTCSPSCSCNDGCGGYNKDKSGSPSCSCNDGCGDSYADCTCRPSCSCNDGCGNSNTDSSCGCASCEDNCAPYSYWDLLKMINGNAAGLAALLKNNINNHNFLALTNMLSHNDKGVTVDALNADCDKDAVINNLFTIIKAIASQNKCRRGCSCGNTCCRCRKFLH
ncbi:keratin-associated protein 5-1-like isoform X2 [Homalodisca vitripennis]|uniref:keratin-associated protein 5-1-like isoform X2 n=1 Tax=Homalodisca vitripennis TaxID=197043 RepID=UPI001EEB31EE|nr:keratin-associated protein 5-1-like isoform X2 [Homalodisca vitripennis]